MTDLLALAYCFVCLAVAILIGYFFNDFPSACIIALLGVIPVIIAIMLNKRKGER